MARHRSPQGRRAHLGPPLSALAAAGVGGAHRSIPVPQLTSSLPVRFVATAVAGGALAAVGQHALVANLPRPPTTANVLRLGVQELFGSAEYTDYSADLTSTRPGSVAAVAPRRPPHRWSRWPPCRRAGGGRARRGRRRRAW